MAKEDNFRGIKSIEIGLPGDGVVGGSLTAFTAVVVNSVSTDGGETNQETIQTEQDDSYLTITTGSEPPTATFKLYEVKGAEAVMLMGGEWKASTKEWKAPSTAPNKYLSVVITDIDGNKLTFPYAKVSARYEGSMTKGELLSVDVKVTGNIPVSRAGVKGSPYIVKFA